MTTLDPLSLLLALEANVVVVDEDFAGDLKGSLEAAIETGARRVYNGNWRTQNFGMRLASRLSYGLVRFMTGVTGYAPEKQSGQT